MPLDFAAQIKNNLLWVMDERGRGNKRDGGSFEVPFEQLEKYCGNCFPGGEKNCALSTQGFCNRVCWLRGLDTQGEKAEIRAKLLLANCLVKSVGEHLVVEEEEEEVFRCCCFVLPGSNCTPKANLCFKWQS